MQKKQTFTMLGIVLVVVRNKDKKFLGVLEGKNRGWWLPGGRVDPPESFEQAAIRETLEEGGIDIQLKGILRVEHQVCGFMRIKVVYYAEPKDEDQIPKSKADEESLLAKWVTMKEYEELGAKNGLRGPELIEWADYLENGGQIYPLDVLVEEGSEISFVN